MTLNEQHKQLYESTLQATKQQITELDRQIEEELAKVKDRLAELQAAKKNARNMYDAACGMLGVPNELEEEEDREEE